MKRGTLVGRKIPWSTVAPLLVASGYLLVMGWLSSIRKSYELNHDEGFDLMKALLVSRGHPLYAEIWSDQPPGFTYLLYWFTSAFGETPEVARLLTILLTSAMLGAIYDLVRREVQGAAGYAAGTLAVLSICLTFRFLIFSSSILIGLPSIAFAILSWHGLVAYGRGRSGLIFAGALFAFGLTIKFFILPFLPILLGLVLFRRCHERGALCPAWKELFWYGFGIVVVLLGALGPVFLSGEGASLYAAHAGAHAASTDPGTHSLNSFVRDDLWLVVPFLLGVFWTARRKSSIGATAISLTLIAALALAHHAPIWVHHRCLFLVPAGAVIGLGWGQTLELLFARAARSRRLIGAALLAALFGSSWVMMPEKRLSQVAKAFSRPTSEARELKVQAFIERSVPEGAVIVSVRQIYAYRLGLEVPPSLAVTSNKRFRAKLLTAEEFLREIVRTSPAAVVLNDDLPRGIREFVEPRMKSYRLAYSDKKNRNVKVYLPDSAKKRGRLRGKTPAARPVSHL